MTETDFYPGGTLRCSTCYHSAAAHLDRKRCEAKNCTCDRYTIRVWSDEDLA